MMKFTTLVMAGLCAWGSAAWAGGNAALGKQKSQVCQSCHGADGNSTMTQYPRLAGQHPDYIVQALTDYKSGARKNPIMNGFAANLSVEDREDIAAYFSSQHGLMTLPAEPTK